MSKINDHWYDLHNDKEDKDDKEDKLDLKKLEKRVQELEKEKDDMKASLLSMKEMVRESNAENLKTVNRLLEAEISLERTKNMLVRNHIPFSFTSATNSILFNRKF